MIKQFSHLKVKYILNYEEASISRLTFMLYHGEAAEGAVTGPATSGQQKQSHQFKPLLLSDNIL